MSKILRTPEKKRTRTLAPTCAHGHPLTRPNGTDHENAARTPDGTRYCRECNRAKQAAHRARLAKKTAKKR